MLRWTEEDTVRMNLWIERWLAEHADELPDMSRMRARQKRQLRWRIAKTEWDKVRKLEVAELKKQMMWPKKI